VTRAEFIQQRLVRFVSANIKVEVTARWEIERSVRIADTLEQSGVAPWDPGVFDGVLCDAYVPATTTPVPVQDATSLPPLPPGVTRT